MIAALDTLQTVKRLEEAGVDDTRAEALTSVLRDARDADGPQLATTAACAGSMRVSTDSPLK